MTILRDLSDLRRGGLSCRQASTAKTEGGETSALILPSHIHPGTHAELQKHRPEIILRGQKVCHSLSAAAEAMVRACRNHHLLEEVASSETVQARVKSNHALRATHKSKRRTIFFLSETRHHKDRAVFPVWVPYQAPVRKRRRQEHLLCRPLALINKDFSPALE